MGGKQVYIIYKVVSPSGKAYVGLTKSTLKERWRQHVKRAFNEKRNHPFYNAIRKYGVDVFTVEHIASALGAKNAEATEVCCIAQEVNRYNLSLGGENNGKTGADIFWGRMRTDPVAMEVYRAKLVLAGQNRPPESAEFALKKKEAAALWRVENPREAWKNSYRASRVSRQRSVGTKMDKPEAPLKERLLAKHKGVFLAKQRSVTEIWAKRTSDEIVSIAIKISKTLKDKYVADEEFKSANTSQLNAARGSVDREKQAKNASAGLKKYWVDLKQDPEKYAIHIKRRTDTLMRTLKKKENAS
jgi:hypothetical protein